MGMQVGVLVCDMSIAKLGLVPGSTTYVYHTVPELFADVKAPGERKQEVLSDMLSDWGWVPCTPHYLVGNEDAWVRGALMLLVDTVGVMVYRKRSRSWRRVGGIGYLSMTGFPVPKYHRGKYEVDFETGQSRRIG